MTSLPPSKKLTVSPAKVVVNIPVERNLSITPGRQRQPDDATTVLLALLGSQMPAPGPVPIARQQETTVLFCDIADYGRLAERVGPDVSFRLVSEVMESVTACVQAHAGRVVDYYGDGVLVLWNHPSADADAVTLACRTALAIQAELPRLSNRWQQATVTPLRLRCTLNVGPALVGNTGTRQCPKFGAIGHTVNLAQRLQSAGKFFGLPILVTAALRSRIASRAFAFRRLGWAKLVGLAEATELYELHAGDDHWRSQRDAYETGLDHFEAKRWLAACQALMPLLDEMAEPLDVACLHLMSRAIEYLKEPPEEFDSAWELTVK